MNTPIFDFVKAYAASEAARFHMPGHKGQASLGCEALDITEIEGADVLYTANGIIEESERNASALFGTAHTYYSTEGSTLCIKAMLGLVARECGMGQKPLILAARNVHKAFVYACALLDVNVCWLYPANGEHLCSCAVTPEDVENALREMRQKPHALYLTSPDYLGKVADIRGIAAVCHAYGVPLLVDNAHGAYLQFLEPVRHPIALGADLCCDSAHKTLPVLTGGAYLHIAKAAEHFCELASSTLSVFASTSPSYLILQSLDLCNRTLSTGYSARLCATVQRLEHIKQHMRAHGWCVTESEPLKLIVHAAKSGYTGKALATYLRTQGIEPEFADSEYLVLMASPENRETDFARLQATFAKLAPKAPLPPYASMNAERGQACLSIREAVFAPRESISVENAVGRICASPTVSCPPAVPIVISGERITEQAVRLFACYGIKQVEVVKEY